MAYRNEIDALEARHRALECEVAERVRARDEVAHMLLEARDRDAAERHFADIAAGGPRRRLRRASWVVMSISVVVGTAVGLNHHKTSSKHAKVAALLVKFERFTDQMCACATPACAQGISDAMTKWSQDMVARDLGTPVTPNETEIKQMTTLAERMSKCMTVAMTPQQR